MPRRPEWPTHEAPDEEGWGGDTCLVSRVVEPGWGFHERRSHSVPWDLGPYWLRGARAAAPSGGDSRRDPVSLEVLFEDLADTWERETAFESVVVRKATHPSYQRIIGLGAQALPLILRRLRREPRQWFWALTAITGEDPAEGVVTADKAAEAWLEWARSHGLAID